MLQEQHQQPDLFHFSHIFDMNKEQVSRSHRHKYCIQFQDVLKGHNLIFFILAAIRPKLNAPYSLQRLTHNTVQLELRTVLHRSHTPAAASAYLECPRHKLATACKI